MIQQEWLASGQADLVAALERHPHLLQDRSLLLNLAIEEFRARRADSAPLDLEDYCSRFSKFGHSIERSILRQLEAQRYVDEHTDILELYCDTSWPQAGDDFGNFIVVEELGRGAIARVFRCLQRDIGHREVVVKAAPYLGVEASVLGRLNHPNIIPILSAGFIDEYNLHYVCTPYCGRSTLADLLDMAFECGCPRGDEVIARAANRWNLNRTVQRKDWRGVLSACLGSRTYIDAILALAIEIADALSHSHQRRILHGDLKPSNILLTPTGRPLLLDFNLSQDLASSIHKCGGTLSYMPPEYLQLMSGASAPRRHSEFNPRSDVYSFGALLYELLSGVTPVTIPKDADMAAETAERLLDQLRQGVPPLQRHNPLVSRRLETIVHRCLAIDPIDRPATMEAVKQSLHAEMRSPASVIRRARVRPLRFSTTRLLPVVMLIAAITYYAFQPPKYLRDYRQALSLVAVGNLKDALSSFDESLEGNPSFRSARFQRGRTRIAVGDVDLAINDFSHLARIDGDAKSMAYLAYCFNRKRVSVAAIPWYERAIRNGARSMPVLNNLGASYLGAQTHLRQSEQLDLAEQNLLEASRLDRNSSTVELNLMRLAVAKSKIDPLYDPLDVWPHIQTILASSPTNPHIQSHIEAWCRAVEEHQTSGERRATSSGTENAQDREAFLNWRQRLGPYGRKAAPALNISSDSVANSSPTNLYFLEPFWPDDQQP